MTRAGAGPVEARSGAPLAYRHYEDRQLMPIAQAIADAVGASAEDWLGAGGQLGLFSRPAPR